MTIPQNTAMDTRKLAGHENGGVSSCRALGGFTNAFNTKNLIFLFPSDKDGTELTNGRRAENKSQEKQGFHLDAAQ